MLRATTNLRHSSLTRPSDGYQRNMHFVWRIRHQRRKEVEMSNSGSSRGSLQSQRVYLDGSNSKFLEWRLASGFVLYFPTLYPLGLLRQTLKNPCVKLMSHSHFCYENMMVKLIRLKQCVLLNHFRIFKVVFTALFAGCGSNNFCLHTRVHSSVVTSCGSLVSVGRSIYTPGCIRRRNGGGGVQCSRSWLLGKSGQKVLGDCVETDACRQSAQVSVFSLIRSVTRRVRAKVKFTITCSDNVLPFVLKGR